MPHPRAPEFKPYSCHVINVADYDGLIQGIRNAGFKFHREQLKKGVLITLPNREHGYAFRDAVNGLELGGKTIKAQRDQRRPQKEGYDNSKPHLPSTDEIRQIIRDTFNGVQASARSQVQASNEGSRAGAPTGYDSARTPQMPQYAAQSNTPGVGPLGFYPAQPGNAASMRPQQQSMAPSYTIQQGSQSPMSSQLSAPPTPNSQEDAQFKAMSRSRPGNASHFAQPPQQPPRHRSPRKRVAREPVYNEVSSDGDITTDDDEIEDNDAEMPVEDNDIGPVSSRKRKFL